MATSMIYLVEDNIRHWETPLHKGTVRFQPLFDLSRTELIEPLGIESVEERGITYLVNASAAKYLVRILRRGSSEEEERILFEGVMGIYQTGKVPGTDVSGFHLKINGRIWVARQNIPRFREKSELYRKGLCRVIFGETTTGRGRDERVRAIIRGYEEIVSPETVISGNYGRSPSDPI
ncbi:hypothetical protein J4413_03760 [Candidatus Woesearchaeota archaeon]|nr:hypothetical protein [Candidatus Woesearchaeota archaeon]